MTMMTFLPPISRWTFLNVGRRRLVDDAADVGRAGERDDAHVVVGRQRRADLGAVAGDQVDDALRDAGLLEDLDEVQRRQRRLRAGLNTTVLPQTSAGMIFHDGIAIGKFHGVMIPQTPSGWRTDIANLLRSSDGVVWPNMRRPSPAM